MNDPSPPRITPQRALDPGLEPADRLDDLLRSTPSGGWRSLLCDVLALEAPAPLEPLPEDVTLAQAQAVPIPCVPLAALQEHCPSAALCLPLALVTSCNPDLVRKISANLGAEARAVGAAVLLLPPVELTSKAKPSMASYGTEPYLAGRISVALVRGSAGQRERPGVALLLQAGPALLTGPTAAEDVTAYRTRRLEPIAELVRDGGLRGLVLETLPQGPLDRDDLRTELGNEELLLFAAAKRPQEQELDRWLEQVKIDAVVRRADDGDAVDWFAVLGEREARRRAARLLAFKLGLGLLDVPPAALPAVEEPTVLEERLALGASVLLKDQGLLPVSSSSRVLVVLAAALPSNVQGRLATQLSKASFTAELVIVDTFGPESVQDESVRERLLAQVNAADLIVLLMDADVAATRLLAMLLAARPPLLLVSLGVAPSPLVDELAEVAGWLQLFGPLSASLSLLPAVLDGSRIPSGRLPYDCYEPTYPPGWGGAGTAVGYGDFSGPTSADSFSVIVLTLVLANDSPRTVVEIPQIYLRDGTDARSDRLLGFARCVLKPAERLRVRYQLDATLLASVLEDGRWQVLPGRFRLYLGRARGVIESELELELTGEPRTLRQRQRVSTLTSIEALGSREED